MERYTIYFITLNALHVSGGFSAHHQELKTVNTTSGICQAYMLLVLTWMSCSNSPTLALAASINSHILIHFSSKVSKLLTRKHIEFSNVGVSVL
jgi:hypothetical protein